MKKVKYLDSIDTCLSNPNEKIQQAAVNALYPLTKYYFPVNPITKKPTDRLQKRIVSKYVNIVQTENNAAMTRGFALALGYLPYKLLVPIVEILENIISCLCHSSDKHSNVGGEGDAETRRNSIISLQRICQTIIIHQNNTTADSTTDDNTILNKSTAFPFIFTTLLSSMEDYNTDRRGDVGSWSRIAAMTALKEILLTIHDNNYINYKVSIELYNEILGSFLKQLSEKLDNIRSHAGSCMQELIIRLSNNDDNNNNIIIPPEHKFIYDSIILLQQQEQQDHKQEEEEEINSISNNSVNWSNASITFPFLIKILKQSYFSKDIISGMVISVGGLTQNVVMHATSSFLEWIRFLEKDNNTFALKQVMQGMCCVFYF